ncbi:hypothetical protein [Phenylobacterium sp.]|uniref:hypothetical protein n=1 Tax=Phenylobacterium sp. TaxID=1871053 RepID=UPI00286E03FF|nr:hypothetical protein [Phenylobacterium sp.]
MRSFVLAASALLVFAACTPQAPDGAAAPPPADAPATPPPATSTPLPEEFAGGMDARGTEPFWGLQIRDTQITLQRPDHPAAVGKNAGMTVQNGKATWETQAGADRLAVTLSSEACSDGMSDLKYDYAAVVVIGSETLKGCAGHAGAMPREGG